MLFNSKMSQNVLKNWGEKPNKTINFAWSFWVGEVNNNTNFINALLLLISCDKTLILSRLSLPNSSDISNDISVIHQMIHHFEKKGEMMYHMVTGKRSVCQKGVFFNQIVCLFGGL